MKRKIINSLILKLSVMVILIESIVLAVIGGYYHQRFEAEIDKRIETQIRIPGILMNRQLLRYESIADRDMISELVGEELVDAMVIGADHRIFYALEPANEGKHIADIPGFDPEWLEPPPSKPLTFSLSSHDHAFLASITPLRAYDGADPFFFVYLKVNSSRSEAQKSAMSRLFALGSAFCLLCTSAGMILGLRTMITAPLSHLEENARQIAQGNLRQTIHIERPDELGRLAHNFLHMRDAIRQKITELQELNQTLEQKVEERTRELQNNVRLLQQEIYERQQIESALKMSENRLNEAQHIARIGSWDIDLQSGETYWSDELFRLYGYTPGEVEASYNLFLQHVHPEDRHFFEEVVENFLKRVKQIDIEFRYYTTSGALRHAQTRGVVEFDQQGNPVQSWGTFQDITDRKQAEEQIKAALREKEVLLREVHHRVKNNLMVVTSLIEMQSEQTRHPEALNLFRDLYNRVMAMSMVHEDLYQSENLAQIEFGVYLQRLVINIRQGFSRTDAAIKIVAEDIWLEIHQAIPCGLIVAELVTNAFKYAFRPGRRSAFPTWDGLGVGKKGSKQDKTGDSTPGPSQEGSRQPPPGPSRQGNAEIRVEMHKEGNAYTLTVSDNGVGLPPEFDMRTSKTLGMSLVRSWAAHQLRGTIEVDSQQGTRFTVTFMEK